MPRTLSLAIVPLFLGACCHFAPCHYGSTIAGTVTDAVSQRPVPGAHVRLYHYEARTAPSGCFALGGPDALPFEFGVSAPGYQSLVVKPAPGSYWAAVTLAPEAGTGKSEARTDEISRERYTELAGNCR
jgi:hypothetical protein